MKINRLFIGVLFWAAFTLFSNSQLIAQSATALPYGYPETARKKISLNQGWKFHLGDPEADLFTPQTDDSEWETVHVPHTLKLTSLTLDDLQDEKTQLVFHRDVGWYRRNLPVTADPEKKVFLEFEGAHQVTDLWVNGIHIGQHVTGGYTPFHFDISAAVKRGASNQISLRVDNRRRADVPPDPGPFDYVKFSGLYRDVYYVETDPLHVTFNWEDIKAGIYITTPTVDPVNKNATINIKTVVRNEYESDQPCELMTRILDRSGIVVLKLTQKATIKAGQDYEFNQIGSLEDNVQLWDTENPYLYRVNTLVKIGDRPVDDLENKLGIRKFELDPVRGFVLNNKPIELFGYNRHQHHAYIGDAMPNSLHYKDVLQFKEMGFNILRTAHYPQDDAIIEACDELGILVYEEAPSWISIPTDEAWWANFEQAARVMVRNHRNHPSIVIWGGGINHRGYVPRIHNATKQEDPVRLTASQGSRWTGWQTSGLTDINANMLYGPFVWDRTEPIFAMEGRNGAAEIAKYKRDPLMIGLVSWTAHAYYTFHPTHARANSKIDRTRSGAMTIFRQPKKGLPWFPSEFKEEPYLYIEEDWKENTTQLTIYSNSQEVALFLNGQPFARQKASQERIYEGLDHPPFIFDIKKYEAGTLIAKGISNGQVITSQKLQTPQEPAAIRLLLDTLGREVIADGSDILVAYAEVVDKNGTRIRDSDHKIEFSVSSKASIIGDKVDIKANPMFTENGIAPILIRAGTEAGTIVLKAQAPGLSSSQASFTTQPFQADVKWQKAAPIYDFEKIRVDMGAPDQLLQFGWTPWNNEDNQRAKQSFELSSGCTAAVETVSGNGILRWLGEMNVMGKYGYVYGDGVLGIDEEGIILRFQDLAAGRYQLKTWHHAPQPNSDHMDPNKEKLKTLRIPSIPFETELEIQVKDATSHSKYKANVTDGKDMHFNAAGSHDLIFESDGQNPVEVIFKGATAKGIWLNGFELSQHY